MRRIEGGESHKAMNALFRAQKTERILPADGDRRALDARLFAGGRIYDFG